MVTGDDKVIGKQDNYQTFKSKKSKTKPKSENLESLENFFARMEVMSSHIDRLHERYMKYNYLNDDYISQEFSAGSSLNADDRIA